MAIKLKSNDSYKEEEPTVDISEKPKKKGNVFAGMLLISLICFFATSLIGLAWATLEPSRTAQLSDLLQDSHRVQWAVNGAGKNLFRYYVEYGGASFETLSDEEKVSLADIEATLKDLHEQFMLDIYDWEARILQEHNPSSEIFQRILREKNETYTALKLALEREELIYDIQNIITGERYSNTHKAEALLSTFQLHDENIFYEWIDWEGESRRLDTAFSRNGWSGSISIPHYSDWTAYSRDSLYSHIEILERVRIVRANFPLFLLICLGLLICSLFIALKRQRQSVSLAFEVLFKCYNVQPLMMKILLALLAPIYFIGALHLFGDFNFSSWYFSFQDYQAEQIQILLLASASLLYMSGSFCYIRYISKDFRRIKENVEFRLFSYDRSKAKWSPLNLKGSSLLNPAKVILFSRRLLLKGLFLIILIGSLLGFLILPSFIVDYHFEVALIFSVMYLIMLWCFYVVTKLMISYIRIESYIQKLSSGELDIVPEEKGLFSEPINNLNNISMGLQKNLAKTLQNERMKTELITNVSHDLKTPLTSIITYVDLLKKLNPQEWEKSVEYLSILESKSERLKILIEDLFDAAKLTSGAIELDLKQVDVVALLNQTLGELEEKIQASSLDFRVNVNMPKLYLMLDGRKIWRAFENLIHNILKYSLPNTRVYIQIEETDSLAIVTMKNVSAYEMNFDNQELLERFVRGDAARSTEGSGLGLSIAKDIVELHDGEFQILTDGDLFKVSMYFKK